MHEVIKDPNGQHLIALFLNHSEIPTARCFKLQAVHRG